MNLYEYATGDPINFFDPLGLGSKSCNVSGSLNSDASGPIHSITGQFLKAFGLKFEVGGGYRSRSRPARRNSAKRTPPERSATTNTL